MGFEYSLSIDIASGEAALAALSARARNLRPAFESIGEALKTSTEQRFERSVDPDGKPWAPLAPRTVREKARLGFTRILVRSRELERSFQSKATDDQVTVGTNKVYAAVHQFGATINRAGRTQTIFRKIVGGELQPRFVKAKQSNFASDHWVGQFLIRIPARPYMGINDADRAQAVAILRDFIGQAA